MKYQGLYIMHSTEDYDIIDHTADIGIRVKGENLPNAIEKSVLALSDLMKGDVKIKSLKEIDFEINETDMHVALVSILEEVLYIFEQKKFITNECTVKIENNKYEVKLKGEFREKSDLESGREIKAITYHNLKIIKKADSCIIEVIFDI